MKLLFVIILTFITSLNMDAYAETHLCEKEVIDLCKNPTAAIDKTTLTCLYENRKVLSPKCHVQLPTIALKEGECMLETIAYCSKGKVPLDHLQDMICLNKHRDLALSPCRKKLAEVKAAGEKRFNDTLDKYAKGCPKEYAECGDVKDPNAGACVAEKFKANKVSPSCRKVILDTLPAKVKK